MPKRRVPFYTTQIYHVFNKTIDHRIIFENKRICKHFIETLKYYRSTKTKHSFSAFSKLKTKSLLKSYLKEIQDSSSFKIEILAYCLMPNHFHLLIKQRIPTGITEYMGQCLNSFTRYYNTYNERTGPFFLPRFKAVLIQDSRQLAVVSRYIHLNPFKKKNTSTPGVVEYGPVDFFYPWSSLKEYMNPCADDLSNKTDIMNLFDNDIEKYKQFILQSK